MKAFLEKWVTDQMEFKLGREIRTNKLTNPMNSFKDRVIKIVDDGNLEALIQKLNNSVRPNEPSTTSHQNALLRRRTHWSFSARGERESKSLFIDLLGFLWVDKNVAVNGIKEEVKMEKSPFWWFLLCCWKRTREGSLYKWRGKWY